MDETFKFPSNEQMMADLEGRIPDWRMQILKDGLAFIERTKARQIARIVANFPPVGGVFNIPKPPRYVKKSVDTGD